MLVILNHFGFGVSGGYIGVCVFFVISGYLISSIIKREVENDEFTVAKFYERRIRRILPAVTVVTIAVLVAGWFVFFPFSYVEVAKWSLWQSFFAGNIYEALTGGDYFALATEEKPLLHYWSLAVEEQFYLFFPLFCVFLYKKGKEKRMALCLMTLLAVSLLFCIEAGFAKSPSAYFLVHTRMWQLLAGAVIPFVKFDSVSRRIGNVIGLCGLGAVIFSAFFYDQSTHYPGFAALLPTVGTVLLIVYTGDLVRKALALDPVVYVGKISYSLYLWHWPVWVYAGLFTKFEGVGPKIMLLLFVLAISAVSHRLIEEPFRRTRASRRQVILSGVGMMLLGMCASVLVIHYEGWPREDGVKVRDALGPARRYMLNTVEVTTGMNNGNGLPKIGDWGSSCGGVVAICGDSHMIAHAPILDRLFRSHGLKGVVSVRSAFAPVPGIWRQAKNQECLQYNESLRRYLLSHKEIQTVVLVSRWNNGNGFMTIRFGDEDGVSKSHTESVEKLEKHLRKFVSELQENGKRVYIMLQVPEHDRSIPNALYFGDKTHVRYLGVSVALHESRQQDTNRALQSVGASVLDPVKWLKRGDGYFHVADARGSAFWIDHDHLTIDGAEFVMPMWEEFLNKNFSHDEAVVKR